MKLHLMYKLSMILVCFLCTLSCQKENASKEEVNSTENAQDANKITKKDIEALDYTEYVYSPASTRATDGWFKLREFDTRINELKNADFSFFDQDKTLLKTFAEEIENGIPFNLNEAPISSRLSALKTTIFKLHDELKFNANERSYKLEATKDLLIAYSNLIFQINKKLEKDNLNIEKPQ